MSFQQVTITEKISEETLLVMIMSVYIGPKDSLKESTSRRAFL